MRVSQEIKSYGFKGIAAMKTHSTREIMDLCENAERLDLLFISGSQFFSNNEYILKLAMDRGTKIRFLCSQVYTPFLSDLEKLEIKKNYVSLVQILVLELKILQKDIVNI